jgi:hypothetical protein
MSTPHPDTQIRMMKEMLEREYEFFNGDVVEINSKFENGYNGVQTTIKFPYYYDWEGHQTYITEKTPVPYTKDELTIIERNPNGKEETMKFFNDHILRSDSQEYRDNYVSP